jgi:hypothetical protein
MTARLARRAPAYGDPYPLRTPWTHKFARVQAPLVKIRPASSVQARRRIPGQAALFFRLRPARASASMSCSRLILERPAMSWSVARWYSSALLSCRLAPRTRSWHRSPAPLSVVLRRESRSLGQAGM